MRDQRINKWANLLVHYSLEAKKGQYAVLVGEVEALPLIEACYEELIKTGLIVDTFITPSGFAELFYRNASDLQLSTPSPALKKAVETCDIYLRIGGESNSKLLANIDPKKQSLAAKARHPIMENIMTRTADKKMRWTYTDFPTPSGAQDANMGTLEYEEFIFNLCRLNDASPIDAWKEMEKAHAKIIKQLTPINELHFKNAQGTDLRVDVSSMQWVNCCGKINFPDGEVYTGPNLKAPNGGVNGVAKFSFPTLYRNVEVENIELTFKNGAVVDAKASKGEAFLKEMIGQDIGAKFVGEIAIGTNPNANRITKNILFDEKFGGTFHLALGQGYPQTGNTNKSALHWDMIFDLRDGGSITGDGIEIYRNGKFIFN